MSNLEISLVGLIILSLVSPIKLESITLYVRSNEIKHEGSSRSSNGSLERIPNPWHMLAWSSKEIASVVGNVIALNEEFLLSSYASSLNWPNIHPQDILKYKYASLRTPKNFDLMHGIKWEGQPFLYNLYKRPVSYNIAIYRLDPKHRKNRFIKLKIPGPEVERNIGGPYENCLAYSWTNYPTQVEGDEEFQAGRKKKYPKSKDENLRFYSSFKVNIKCLPPDSLNCTAEAEVGKLCYLHKDLGVPVLCGRQKKLTFFIDFKPKEPGCSSTFTASHISDIVDRSLDKQVISRA